LHCLCPNRWYMFISVIHDLPVLCAECRPRHPELRIVSARWSYVLRASNAECDRRQDWRSNFCTQIRSHNNLHSLPQHRHTHASVHNTLTNYLRQGGCTVLRMSDCSLTTFRTQLKTLLFIWYIVYRQLHFLTAGPCICGLLEGILHVTNSLNNTNNNNLCVCLSTTSCTHRIFLKISPEMYLWRRKMSLNFVSHLDLVVDLGIFWRILQHYKEAHFPTVWLIPLKKKLICLHENFIKMYLSTRKSPQNFGSRVYRIWNWTGYASVRSALSGCSCL